VFLVIVESITVRFPGEEPLLMFWIPPESPFAPVALVALFPDTSECVSTSVPPTFEIPPPLAALPPRIQSSLSVRFPALATFPPNPPLAFPNSIRIRLIVTVGALPPRGAWIWKTRACGEDEPCTVVPPWLWGPAPTIATLRVITKGLFCRRYPPAGTMMVSGGFGVD
jgi:hypothetical protein